MQRVGSMLTLFDRPVRELRRRARVRHRPLRARSSGTCSSAGIYVAPSQFEAMFVSLAHSDEDVDATVEAVADFFRD